jgi:hypothetical protein
MVLSAMPLITASAGITSYKRVIERAQIGVDLLLHVTGQEAEPLASLYRGPGQDDTINLAGHQVGGGADDGEIGLAGAGRANPEYQFIGSDGFEIGLLAGRTRGHHLAPGADAGDFGFAGGGNRHRDHGHADGSLDIAGTKLQALQRTLIQVNQHLSRHFAAALCALNGNLVATRRDVDAEPVLDKQQVLIMLTKDKHEQAVVIKAQGSGAEGGCDARLAGSSRLGLKRPWAQRAFNS